MTPDCLGGPLTPPPELNPDSLVQAAAEEIVKAAAAGVANLPQRIAAWWRDRGAEKQIEVAAILGQTMTALQSTDQADRAGRHAEAKADWRELLEELLLQHEDVAAEIAEFVDQQRAKSRTSEGVRIHNTGDAQTVGANYGTVSQVKKYTRWDLGLGPLLGIIAVAVLGIGSATAVTINAVVGSGDDGQFSEGACLREDLGEIMTAECDDVMAFAQVDQQTDDSRDCEARARAVRLGESGDMYCLDPCIYCDVLEAGDCFGDSPPGAPYDRYDGVDFDEDLEYLVYNTVRTVECADTANGREITDVTSDEESCTGEHPVEFGDGTYYCIAPID